MKQLSVSIVIIWTINYLLMTFMITMALITVCISHLVLSHLLTQKSILTSLRLAAYSI
jgi:hypothetical protein